MGTVERAGLDLYGGGVHTGIWNELSESLRPCRSDRSAYFSGTFAVSASFLLELVLTGQRRSVGLDSDLPDLSRLPHVSIWLPLPSKASGTHIFSPLPPGVPLER